MRPLLLDLFCGAGGCSVGYYRAGFDVVGVDHVYQPRYPGEFILADALEFLRAYGHLFDCIHASPPCQGFSVTRNLKFSRGAKGDVPDLLTPCRAILEKIGVPWVIENVKGAPMRHPVELCGLSFGLKVLRHRLFDSSHLLMGPGCPGHAGVRIGVGGFVCMVGHSDPGRKNVRIPYDRRSVSSWRLASGIDWMRRDELAQAIPSAYTEFIGRQLLAVL